MPPSDKHLETRLQIWVERLVESSDPDRTLLQAALALGAQAAAVWRKLGDGRMWPVLERGPADLLPPAEQVLAVLEGRLAVGLPHQRFVLGATGGRLALAVGGLEEEDVTDVLDALLVIAASLDSDASEHGDGFAPPFPGFADDEFTEF